MLFKGPAVVLPLAGLLLVLLLAAVLLVGLAESLAAVAATAADSAADVACRALKQCAAAAYICNRHGKNWVLLRLRWASSALAAAADRFGKETKQP
jgi:hypothetical protein